LSETGDSLGIWERKLSIPVALADLYAKDLERVQGSIGNTINASPSQPASTLSLQSESTMTPSSIESSEREFVVTSSTLKELMNQKLPEDLTGQVIVPDFRRPAHGGFATVHKGKWNDKTVGLFLVLHTAL
jgi:hypothetical protein